MFLHKTVSCICWQGKSQSFLIYASLAHSFEEKQQLWLNDLQWVPSIVWLVWQHVNGLLLTYPGCGQFGGAHFQVMLTQQRMCSLQDEWNQMMKWDQQFLLSKDWVKCECLSLSDAKQQICRQLAGPVIQIELCRWTSYLSKCECDDIPWSTANPS